MAHTSTLVTPLLMEQPGELTCGRSRGHHIVEQCHMPVVVRRHLKGAAQIAPPLAGTEPGLLRGCPDSGATSGCHRECR